VGTLDHFKFGRVGRAMPGVEVKIAEEDSEILMRGPNVFKKYWDNEEATSETLIDGAPTDCGDAAEVYNIRSTFLWRDPVQSERHITDGAAGSLPLQVPCQEVNGPGFCHRDIRRRLLKGASSSILR